MAGVEPVLELLGAVPSFDETGFAPAPYDLRLMPGDCAVISCRDADRGTMFADLCSGLVTLTQGAARCQGLDWRDLAELQADALRGRIGRISRRGAWLDGIGTDANILLPQLHHTTRRESVVVQEAVALAEGFGLPGLPVAPPQRLSVGDLLRAACVRAFLGPPALLLLENPIAGAEHEIMTPFLDEVTRVRHAGAAVVLLVRSMAEWRPHRALFTHGLHLIDEGLFAMRKSA